MSSYLSYFSRDPSSNFAYEVGAEITGLDSSQSIWTIHEGKLKKAPHTKVTVFVYDVKVILLSYFTSSKTLLVQKNLKKTGLDNVVWTNNVSPDGF